MTRTCGNDNLSVVKCANFSCGKTVFEGFFHGLPDFCPFCSHNKFVVDTGSKEVLSTADLDRELLEKIRDSGGLMTYLLASETDQGLIESTFLL